LTVAAFERRGIDLFRDRFPVRLFGEGTVRGSGGIDLVDDTCGTGVPGLYAAGDAATRERVAGASSGGGAVNSAWALSSGRIAGAAAAAQARRAVTYDGTPRALGQAGLRPHSAETAIDTAALIRRAGAAMHDYDKAFWRREDTLAASALILETDWHLIAGHGHATGPARAELRAAAAVVATARWAIASARERRETRGMHYRDDARSPDPAQAHRLLSGGLDDVWVRPVAPAKAEVAA